MQGYSEDNLITRNEGVRGSNPRVGFSKASSDFQIATWAYDHPHATCDEAGRGALRRLEADERTVATLLRLGAEEWSDRPCLRISGRSLTYAETADEAARAAGMLAEAGVRAGDRV